jgi:translocation and assembly module TamA
VPSYNLEVYQLDHVITPPSSNNPTNALPNPLLTSCVRNVCLLSYLEQRIEWDGRDDPLNTRRGFYAALTVQEGWHVGGFGYQFLKVVPEARLYLPLGERSVLAARARLGAFIPLGETRDPPTVALFESGGANSMRGYGQNRLSPMACVTRSVPDPGDSTRTVQVCTNQWYPVGGNGLAEYSVELRFPLRGSLFGALFTDAGYVSGASAVPNAYRQAFVPARLQWAGGLGIRYRTPVGPLRLDLAGRAPDDLSPGVDLNHRFPPVPLGTHREPVVVLQLTIGEAF